MKPQEIKVIAENYFIKNKTNWHEGTEKADTTFGFRLGYFEGIKDYDTIKKQNALLIEALEKSNELLTDLKFRYALSEWIGEPCRNRIDAVNKLLNEIKK